METLVAGPRANTGVGTAAFDLSKSDAIREGAHGSAEDLDDAESISISGSPEGSGAENGDGGGTSSASQDLEGKGTEWRPRPSQSMMRDMSERLSETGVGLGVGAL